jgi:selenide,water dikinase
LQRQLLCDPQTSGGLLLAVLPEAVAQVLAIAEQHGITLNAIGELHVASADKPLIEVA